MKAIIRNTSRTLFLVGGITLATTVAHAQMKIGDNPSVIKKSAILELSSEKQGLLLPRLPNFTAINTAIGADVVDGMVVYLASGVAADDGIYMRRAGAWVKIASAGDALANWSLKGNAGTTATDYIGTSDALPLSIRANATEGISVQTDGSVQLKQVAANTALLEVLMIGANGTVAKRTIDAHAFSDLLLNVSNTAAAMTKTATADGQLTFNVPVMTGAAAQQYGFLTIEDWNKLQALSSGANFSVADFITTVAAGEANRGGRISYDAATANYTLELVAAGATQAGIVTAGTQTFGGAKTFNGAVEVVGATTLDNTLTVTGLSTLNGATTVNNTLEVTGATTLGNNLSVAGTTTLTGAASLANTLNVAGATTLNTLAVTNASTLNGTLSLNSVADAATAASYDVLVREGAGNTVTKKAFNLDAIATAIQIITAGAGQTTGTDIQLATGTTGTDFNINADGTNTVTFNLPNASAVDGTHPDAQRGVVSTGDQSFAGNKSFAANVAVGGTAAANSTLQVEGSVSMAIKSVSTAYTITALDNTILADASTAAFTVTLPAPSAAITGRIYTIKKVGNGGIDHEVTVMPGGGSIEGSLAGAGYVIYNDWTFITVQTDGTNWYIIKK